MWPRVKGLHHGCIMLSIKQMFAASAVNDGFGSSKLEERECVCERIGKKQTAKQTDRLKKCEHREREGGESYRNVRL